MILLVSAGNKWVITLRSLINFGSLECTQRSVLTFISCLFLIWSVCFIDKQMWAQMFYLLIKKIDGTPYKVCWCFMDSSGLNMRFFCCKTYKSSYSSHKFSLSIFYIKAIWYLWFIQSDQRRWNTGQRSLNLVDN